MTHDCANTDVSAPHDSKVQIVRVDFPSKSYLVHVGEGALAGLGAQVSQFSAVFMVIDQHVAALHGSISAMAVESAGRGVHRWMMPAGEGHKTLAQAGALYDRLAELGIDRHGVLVAVGGGQLGDLVGFVASTWLRGIGFVNCPTTLLAAVDASVGGKTALNHAGLKNRIGTFYQPAAVLVDTRWLHTLDGRQWSSGLAECIKHALIAGPEFLDWLQERLDDIRSRKAPVTTELIVRSVRTKAEIVIQDEHDLHGVRARLNLGHTLGHALEAASDYGLSHGECVGLGMLGAFVIARALGRVSTDDINRLESLLARCGLATRLPFGLSQPRIRAALAADKKSVAGRLRFVLPCAGGGVSTDHEVDAGLIGDAITYLGCQAGGL